MKTAACIVVSLVFVGAAAIQCCAQSKGTAPSKGALEADAELFKSGLWLCSDAGNPYSLDRDISDVYSHGVKLTYSILDELAKQHGCVRADSDALKPIDLYGDMWKVSDGKSTGWASTKFYFAYMNFHTVRKADAANTSADEAWLCPQEANAQGLYADMYDVSSDGLKPSHVLKELATKNKCAEVTSNDLKPVNIVSGYQRENVQVSDGKNTGWIPSSLYLAYMRTHVVRPR